MVAPTSCTPCNCIGGNMNNDYFKQSMLVVMCDILTALQGGGGAGEDVNVASFGGTAVSLGQAAMAASMPVVIASNQSSLPVTLGTGTNSIGDIRSITTSVTPGTAAANLGKAEGGAYASGDVGVTVLGIANDSTSFVNRAALGGYVNPAYWRTGIALTDINTLGQPSASKATSILKNADSASNAYVAGTDAGVAMLGVRNTAFSSLGGTNGRYTPVSLDGSGRVYANLDNGNGNPIKSEDSVANSSDPGFPSLAVRQDVMSALAADGDYTWLKLSDLGQLYVDTVRRGTLTGTTPTFTNATSFTLVAANTARRYLLIQNNSGANIMVSLSNATLTGIVPTSTNIGIVIPPNGSYETPPNFAPTSAITGYQTSGGSINTVVVYEG